MMALEEKAAMQGKRQGEAGYMLLAVVVMVALVLLALSVAAPLVAKDLRRDKEVESEHRAQQYVRALRLYYRQLKNYPPSLDALEKSNNIRFLRQRYVDPLTGKADWRLIHVGEQKTTVKGFFGEPLGGLNTSGAGTAAASMGSGFAAIGAGSGGSGSSTIGATSGLAAGFAGATIGSNTSVPGASGATGASGSTGSSGFGSSGFGSGGLGQIMGVGSARSGASILTPNAQGTYESWEFLYDPRIEQLYAKANILGGGVGGGSAAGISATTGLSGASGASGASGVFGSGGGFGSGGSFGSGGGFGSGASGSTGVSGSTGATGFTGRSSGFFGSSPL